MQRRGIARSSTAFVSENRRASWCDLEAQVLTNSMPARRDFVLHHQWRLHELQLSRCRHALATAVQYLVVSPSVPPQLRTRGATPSVCTDIRPASDKLSVPVNSTRVSQGFAPHRRSRARKSPSFLIARVQARHRPRQRSRTASSRRSRAIIGRASWSFIAKTTSSSTCAARLSQKPGLLLPSRISQLMVS